MLTPSATVLCWGISIHPSCGCAPSRTVEVVPVRRVLVRASVYALIGFTCFLIDRLGCDVLGLRHGW